MSIEQIPKKYQNFLYTKKYIVYDVESYLCLSSVKNSKICLFYYMKLYLNKVYFKVEKISISQFTN